MNSKCLCMLRHQEKQVDQLLCFFSDRLGAPMQSSYHTDTLKAGFDAAQMLTVYTAAQSRYYKDSRLCSAILATLHYIKSARRNSGLFDLSSCNFDSAPDTAFTLNALIDAFALCKDADVPAAAEIRTALLEIIESAAEGICSGGFHTPNHRWAISACLLQAAELTGCSRFREEAGRYLAEGLDINTDGEFAERSAGTYNAVNDDQMIRLYLTTGNSQYLDAAKANLNMMLCYLDPDGSIFTYNSTRQDYGHKVWPGSYYILYLLTGYLSGDARFAAWSQVIWNFCVQSGEIPHGLPWLLRYPDLEEFAAQAAPDLTMLTAYSRIFSASSIGRWRKDDLTMTVLAGKPDFLHISHGSASLYLSIYSNVCDRRNFIADAIEPAPNGCRLHAVMDSWYYLPFDGDGPDTQDWWQMNNADTRRRQVRDRLETTIDIAFMETYVRLHLSTKGLTGVPVRLEMAFTPGTLQSNSFLMEAPAGGSITVKKDPVEMISSGSCLNVSPCFAAHNVQNRMGGALSQSPDRFTVYCTLYTPSEQDLVIGTSPLFPPDAAFPSVSDPADQSV